LISSASKGDFKFKNQKMKPIYHLKLKLEPSKYSLPGYSLVTVLVLMVFLSVIAALVFRVFSLNGQVIDRLQADLVRYELMEMTASRLMSGKTILMPGENGSEVIEGHAFYPVSMTWKTWQWGIHEFLTVSAADHAGSSEKSFRVEEKLPVPERTTILYDQPGFGLVLAEGTELGGPVLLRYPELRLVKLNQRSGEPLPLFKEKVYQLNTPIFPEQVEIPTEPNFNQIPESVRSGGEFKFVNMVTGELPDSLTTGWIDYPVRVTVFSFPKGDGNQVVFRKSATLKSGEYRVADLVFLGDTLTAEPGVTINGNLWAFAGKGKPAPVVILKKPFQINGNVIVNGLLRAEGAEINGRLIANQLAVYHPPTEYVHYLVGITVTGSPGKMVSLPWFFGDRRK